MRSYPQGVTIVTFQTGHESKGITVSSFISVSLDPPLVLVSIAKGTPTHDQLSSAKAFAVNFLAYDQESLSDRFAGRKGVQGMFGGPNFKLGVSGAPIIEGVRAVIECKAWAVYEGGDHSLVIGEVVSVKSISRKKPLLYYEQQYTSTESSHALEDGRIQSRDRH